VDVCMVGARTLAQMREDLAAPSASGALRLRGRGAVFAAGHGDRDYIML